MLLLKGQGRRLKEFKFHATIPHLDNRLVLGVYAHERRVGMEFFKIAADRPTFGNAGAVVEFEHGQGAHGVLLRPEFLTAIDRVDDINLFVWDLDAFFRNEYPHPAWVGRGCCVMDFHTVLP